MEVTVNGTFTLNTNTTDKLLCTINSNYAPPYHITNNGRTNSQVHLSLLDNGNVVVNNFTETANPGALWAVFNYRLY